MQSVVSQARLSSKEDSVVKFPHHLVPNMPRSGFNGRDICV